MKKNDDKILFPTTMSATPSFMVVNKNVWTAVAIILVHASVDISWTVIKGRVQVRLKSFFLFERLL